MTCLCPSFLLLLTLAPSPGPRASWSSLTPPWRTWCTWGTTTCGPSTVSARHRPHPTQVLRPPHRQPFTISQRHPLRQEGHEPPIGWTGRGYTQPHPAFLFFRVKVCPPHHTLSLPPPHPTPAPTPPCGHTQMPAPPPRRDHTKVPKSARPCPVGRTHPTLPPLSWPVPLHQTPPPSHCTHPDPTVSPAHSLWWEEGSPEGWGGWRRD